MNVLEFYEKASVIHEKKYGYNLFSFKKQKEKMEIFCEKHGMFLQTPEVHLMGCGCPECGKLKSINSRRMTKEEFVKRSKQLYGGFYSYEFIEIENLKKKIKIICPEHGEFWQTPDAHLRGHKCPACSKCARITQEDFIFLSKQIHGDKYDYSKVDYKQKRKPVLITCPLHGEFMQLPKSHLNGCGCPKCANNVILTTEEFINKCLTKWGDIYDYSKTKYLNAITKVDIICKKHGIFSQTPNSHLAGHGCPSCASEQNCGENRLYEAVKEKLDKGAVLYYKPTFLKKQHIDIFLPSYNVGIEYQGEQHFKPIDFFGGEEGYKKTVERDIRKYKSCKENGFKLYYFSECKEVPSDYFSKVYINYNDLIKTIIDETEQRT